MVVEWNEKNIWIVCEKKIDSKKKRKENRKKYINRLVLELEYVYIWNKSGQSGAFRLVLKTGWIRIKWNVPKKREIYTYKNRRKTSVRRPYILDILREHFHCVPKKNFDESFYFHFGDLRRKKSFKVKNK